jgi:hypothetical protein
MAEPSSSSRQVNDILHRLRGEQFRRSQNQKASRSHPTTINHGYQTSLPSGVRNLSLGSAEDTEPQNQQPDLPQVSAAGPAAPKSWNTAHHPLPSEDRRTSSWRSKALSPSFYHAPFKSRTMDTHVAIVNSAHPKPSPVITLTLLCLRLLFKYYSSDEQFSELLFCIPVHLRVLVIRDAAVFAPSSCSMPVLKALGLPDGEVIVVGSRACGNSPSASIRQLLATTSTHDVDLRTSVGSTSPSTVSVPELTWDSPIHDIISHPPLRTLILLCTKLSLEDITCLPATLTNLSLIDMETPVHLQKLPASCPLVTFLDLSYNKWLEWPNRNEPWALGKVPWHRWKRLSVLCLRGCLVLPETVTSINQSRWDDVRMIFTDPEGP